MAANTLSRTRTRPRRPRGLAVVGSVLIAMTLVTGSASATIVERSRLTQPYEFDNWDCGYELHITGVSTDQVQVRADKKLDNAFFTDNYQFRETWTGPDGRWFTVSGNGLFKDLPGKSLGGSLYEFSFHNVGQPFTVTDSTGRIISRDRGNLTGRRTVDFADGSENFLGFQLKGPHPSFDLDLCRAVQPLTGGDSARYLTPRPIGSTASPDGFYEYLPPSYSATGAPSPLLLFFNGYGENGDGTAAGLSNLLFAGIPRYMDIGGWDTDRPFVVLSHQHIDPGFDFSPCDGVDPWFASCAMQVQHDLDNASPAFCTTPDEVHDFIAYALDHYNVDPTRVYITGLSCGAYGVWEYLAKYHDDLQVAAAVPIAGDGRPGFAPSYCDIGATPVWAFHGALDLTVNPLGSIEPMTALAGCGVVPADEAQLTVYPDRDHNSWDPAYAERDGNDIYSWMLGFTHP
jgi:predicted esterase